MRLDLDCAVTCADGAFGELSDVIIDPGIRRVTHLVVQPAGHHHHHLARLMPIGRARAGERAKGGVVLDCTVAQVNELHPIHTAEYVRLADRPAHDADSDVGIEDEFALPPSELLGAGAMGIGMEPIDVDPHVTVSFDRVPAGTVEIRRDSAVSSSDGHHVGHVVGFVLDDRAQIARLVLEHGHLWGKRELQIPGASIDRILSDEVVLTLSKDEVGR
jgi:sporulation protein YlmC with PRC-barrel domain